jgi:putative peptidoglycan lipid II flippase
MLKGAFTVGMWTMASRILGFARDILIAAILGTGPVSDAFSVAFRLLNLFRRGTSRLDVMRNLAYHKR